MSPVNLTNKTCLVTGAAGFIGSKLCQELMIRGATVKQLMRESTDIDEENCYFCELGKQEIPEDAVRNVDIIFHLAGRSHFLTDSKNQEQLYYQTNVIGTKSLLEAAKRESVKKFIYFSSVKVMGEECDYRLDESHIANPETVYGKSKLNAEKIVLGGNYVESPTILRLVMVYGDSEKGNLAKLVNAISKRWFPPIPKIENKRSMIHVDDVIQFSVLAACDTVSTNKTYILCDEHDYSTRFIYELIKNALGKNVPSWGMPLFVFRIIAMIGDLYSSIFSRKFIFDSNQMRKLFGNSFYSSKKIITELGFKPKRCLENSIREIIIGSNSK